MRREKADVVIVGSGFAGLVAANRLAERGLDVLLLDENIHLGGQLLRQLPGNPAGSSRTHADHTKKVGFDLIDQLKNKKLKIMNQTRLLGVYPRKELVIETEEKETVTLDYDVLLFATGARERFLPFPGWTLPGVYSTGMVQVMVKSYGLRCDGRLLIGGSGLFLLAVAYEFLKNRGRVLAICDSSGILDKVRFLPLIFSQYQKYWEGARYGSRILLSGVPIKYRTKVVEARGKKGLEEVVIARVDGLGRVREGTEKVIPTTALAVGYGFVPNIELPQLAGCELDYSPDGGGWVVKVDDRLETSVGDIFAAGETTGVGGAFKSLHEGELAANAILYRFEKIAKDEYQKKEKKWGRKRRQDLKFGALFNRLFSISESDVLEIPDDTIICRCEDVTMKELKAACERGFSTPGSLKLSVRTGMGNCQGRTCGPIVSDILSVLTGKNPVELGPLSVRPPVKPVSIHSLINHSESL